MVKGFFSKQQLPNWKNITVEPTIAHGLGFKTESSNFYVISDKKKGINEESTPESIKKRLHRKKPLFRGVYCEAGIENVKDILSDLQKYCELTGMPGLVFLNGKEYNTQPQIVTSRSKNSKTA